MLERARSPGSMRPRYPPSVAAYRKPSPGVATFEPKLGPIVWVRATYMPWPSAVDR